MRKIPAALNAQFNALLVKNKIPQKFHNVTIYQWNRRKSERRLMPFQALIKDYKSDRIFRIFRIFLAFPEERQKVSTLFEGTNWTNSGKSLT
jgi:hypothetical protein